MDRGAFVMPVLALAVLAGVWASEKITEPIPEAGKIHVKYWEKWTSFEFDAMKHVVDEFNKSQNRIQVDILSVSGIENKTLMAVSGKIPPDVAGLYGPNVTQYADNHAVMRLDDMCKEAGIKAEDYIPVYWDMSVVRNHIYGLPSTPASTALHYNRQLFRDAGLNPDVPPKTIEELDMDAEKITRRDPSTNHIAISGFLPAEPGWWNWAWGPIFGGRLMDDNGKLTINQPDSVKGYEWVQSFSKKYGASQLQTFRSGFGSFSSPQNAFMTSQNAMEIQGVWMYNFITMFAPKLDWSVAPFPYPAARPDLVDPVVVDLDVLCIPTGAKHPKEAFEFIKYVQSQKGMEMLCLGQKKLSPLRKVSPEFYAHHPNPYIKLFTKLAYSKNSYYPPKFGMWPEYSDEINSAFDDVVLIRKTPQQAMDDLVARLQPKVDRYLERLKMRGEE